MMVHVIAGFVPAFKLPNHFIPYLEQFMTV